MQQEIATVEQFAQVVQVHRDTVYGWIATGQIQGARKIGGVWRIHLPTAIDWIAKGKGARK